MQLERRGNRGERGREKETRRDGKREELSGSLLCLRAHRSLRGVANASDHYSDGEPMERIPTPLRTYSAQTACKYARAQDQVYISFLLLLLLLDSPPSSSLLPFFLSFFLSSSFLSPPAIALPHNGGHFFRVN